MKYSRDLSKPLAPTFGDEPKKRKKSPTSKAAPKANAGSISQRATKKANKVINSDAAPKSRVVRKANEGAIKKTKRAIKEVVKAQVITADPFNLTGVRDKKAKAVNGVKAKTNKGTKALSKR